MEIGIRTVSTPGKGSLSFFESLRDVPFEIRRVYYIHGAPAGVLRGGHAHRDLKQLLVCIAGAVEVVLDDGSGRRSCVLDVPSKGLLVEGLVWRDMRWLEEGSVLMVAASDYYDEADYIRSRAVFDREVSALGSCGAKTTGGGGRMISCEVLPGPGRVVSACEGGFPFEVKRVYCTCGVPSGALRGGHAHRGLNQLLVCPAGAVEVFLDDGREKGSVLLDDPAEGLLVGPMVWHDMRWAEKGSVLSVLASDYYDEADYIRDYGEFEQELGRIVAAREEGLR